MYTFDDEERYDIDILEEFNDDDFAKITKVSQFYCKKYLCKMKNLQSMHFKTIDVMKFDIDLLSDVPKLKELTISGYYINQKLLDAIFNLRQLTTLIIIANREDYSNNIYKLTSKIKSLRRLKMLILHNVDIAKLPTEIGSLTQLEHLEVKSKTSIMIPKSITKLRKLKLLALSKICNIIYIQNLRLIPNLETLKLEIDNIATITSFKYMTKLKNLSVSSNSQFEIPNLNKLQCMNKNIIMQT